MIGSGFLEVWEHECATICMPRRNVHLRASGLYWLRRPHDGRSEMKTGAANVQFGEARFVGWLSSSRV
jgi:hypothetical protein